MIGLYRLSVVRTATERRNVRWILGGDGVARGIASEMLWVTAMLSLSLLPSSVRAQTERPKAAETFPVFLTPSLRHGLDTTASPCVDFDQFANGGWRKNTVLPDSMDRLSVFNATYHQTQLLIVALLDSARLVAATSKDADFRVLGMYYESCLRADSIPKVLDRISMYQGLKRDTSRTSRCGRLAMHHLPVALGQAFVRAVLPPTAEAKAQQMIEAIRTQIASRVSALPAVPADAKARTLAALTYMTFKVAKPSDTVDYSGLSLTPADFLTNQRKVQEYTWKYKLVTNNGERKPIWKDNQYNPNAHFNPGTNSIEIPTFLFQWPFFDVQTEEALSYAAAGTILGHEVMHGVTWKLGSEGEASVYKRAQVLVQQYSALQVAEGLNVNGALTLNENLADLGGVLVAYDAWSRVARASAVPLLEGFTPEQRFFLHYARLFREKTTMKALQTQLGSDSHSPGPARVNGVVMNVPAFAKAFGCKDGDPMAKPASERANVW